jgi:hypothetical protein
MAKRAMVALAVGLILVASATGRAEDAAAVVRARYGASRFEEASLHVRTDGGSHVRIELPAFGGRRTLELERVTVRGPHFDLLVQGADGHLARRRPRIVRAFRGRVLEEPDAVVSAVLGTDGLRATVYRDGMPVWRVRPLRGVVRGASRRRHVVFTEADRTLAAAQSPIDAASPPPLSESAPDARSARLITPAGPKCSVQVAELGIDAASSYYESLGSSVAATQARIEESVAALNAIYVRDAMLEYRLGRVIVRTSAASDPYAGTMDMGVILNAMVDEWNTNQSDSAHDVASVIVHNFAGSGLAFLPGACTASRYAACGSNPDLGDDFDVVLRHELGHLWGSPHFPGGVPGIEGSTIMSGNGEGRISGPELYTMLGYRETLTCLDESGPFTSAVEPYGRLDEAIVSAGHQATLDVLANDHDANCETLALDSFDTTSALGGTITRSTGTGVGGRDEVLYTGPATAGTDSFFYRVKDGSPSIGTGKVIVEVLAAPTALYEAEDATLAGTTDSSVFSGFSGRGYGAVLSPGGTIEWTVTTRAATTASLALRYARPEDGAGTPSAEIRVNDVVVASELSMPTTHDWTVWKPTASVPVTLQAGPNVVHFTYLRPFEMHVDQLRVAWDDAAAANAPPRFRAYPVWEVEAAARTPYSAALAAEVDDPDVGDTRSFTLVSAPAWVHVGSDGTLSGTPDVADVGTAVVTVRVTDSLGASTMGVVRIPVGCGDADLDGDDVPDGCDSEDGMIANARVALASTFSSSRANLNGTIPSVNVPFVGHTIGVVIADAGSLSLSHEWDVSTCQYGSSSTKASIKCASLEKPSSKFSAKLLFTQGLSKVRASLRGPGNVVLPVAPATATVQVGALDYVGHPTVCTVRPTALRCR